VSGSDSLIVELRANGTKAGSIDLVRLPVPGNNEAFAAQSLEDVERTVGQKETVTVKTIDGRNAALVIAPLHDAATLGEDMERPLLRL
jgi:hypothetical protein